LTHAGQTRHSGVWWKPRQRLDNPVYNFRDADESKYEETDYESRLTPSNLQTDVRLARAADLPPREQREAERLAQLDNELQAKPENLNVLFQRALARRRLGQDA